MNGLDSSIFNFTHYLAGKFWLLDWLGIFLAKYLPYILVLAVLYFLLKEGTRRRIYFFALVSLSVILSRGIITELIRFFYSRQRPFSALEIAPLINADLFDSFPSGHAAAFFALSTSIFYLDRKAGRWFFALSALIAIARVFSAVHWPSDVLGGAIIGILSAILVRKTLPKPEN